MNCVLILILTWTIGVFSYDFPEVKLNNGKVRGSLSKTYLGKDYMEFIGIPFAQPPIGALRFEDPKPAKNWEGTWIANLTVACMQISHWPTPKGGISNGEEDCLYLDVFVPGNKIDKWENLDVIVHIHGGAFMFGSKSSYPGPKYMLDRNVILININYRVGVFGFLSTGDRYLPGNLGMKDQSMALKWVKENVKQFGGNPDSITITGLSAGGASVHFHYFSPLSKGLFNRGISVSGCALNAWAMQEKPLEKAYAIGNVVGCDQKDTEKLVECLKNRNAKDLNEATRSLRPWNFEPFSPIGLVVDKKSRNPFLPEHPYKMLVEEKVLDLPWIASASTSEGLYPAAEYALSEEYFTDLEKHWGKLAPLILHYSDSIPEKNHQKIAEDIQNKYMDGKEVNRKTYKELIQAIGDRLFVADLELSARLHAKAIKSPVYFYIFDYTGIEMPTLATLFTGSNEKHGVCHGEDIMYLFSDTHGHFEPKMHPTDEKMKELLLDIWTKYAKDGSIAVENWEPVDKKIKKPLKYLYIGSPDNVEMKSSKELGERSFWEKIPFEENANLFPKQSIKIEL